MAESLNASLPIIETNGTMADAFRTWTIRVSDGLDIIGTGTPEGVVQAPQFTRFVDLTDPLIPVEYMKTQAQIGGDILKGWAVL